jgi:glycosyltransferase involved in cell wall biosynthesis
LQFIIVLRILARRILIINNRVPFPMNDGGNMAVHAMIEGYHKEGYEVYLLAMNTSRHYVAPEQLSEIYRNIYAFETEEIDNSISTGALLKNYLFSRLPNHAQRFYDPSFEKKIEKIITAFKPDVIQIESIFLSEYLHKIKKHTRAVTVLRLHNIEHHIWEEIASKTKNIIKRFYLNNLATRIRRYEKKAWHRYDLLLPITEKDTSVVRHAYSKANILTIPFGIDATGLKYATDNYAWVGYHLGAMDWRPNVDGIKWFLKYVWKSLKKQMPDFKFYFAGRNMPEYFKNTEIDGVMCAGEVEDAGSFISDKKILIVPIHSGSGIRVKILEAMAAGKLVISTQTGMDGIDVLPEIHYLRANKPHEFVKAVLWALNNKSEAEIICKNASEMVRKRYDRDAIAQSLKNKIDALVEEKKKGIKALS